MTHDRDKTWRTANGRSIAIRDIDNGHLVNIVNWILDNPESYPATVLNLMVAEVKFRQLPLFSEGKAYPQKIGKRWKLLDPVSGKAHIIPPPPDYIEAVKDNNAYQTMSQRTQLKRKKDKNGQ